MTVTFSNNGLFLTRKVPFLLPALLFAAAQCLAAVEAVSPVGGGTVALVPEAQKKVMSLPTLAERLALFAKDKASGKVLRDDPLWRKPLPFTLAWQTTGEEVGPWKVEIGKAPDLSDARTWFFPDSEPNADAGHHDVGPDGGTAAREVSRTIPMANLEVARDYYWRVSARIPCTPACGSRHRCKGGRRIVRSAIASFRTEDFAPRWIEIEGKAGNIRDLGGWRTADGRRVRQGMAFRGQGLNDNSLTGDVAGANRLTVEDVKYLAGTLGIRTDLDLRNKGETAGMEESPLGAGVAFVQQSSECYKGIFGEAGKKAMAESFRVFCRPENYPIYFHCIGGADRTGSLAYVLLGVLGVDRHDIEVDWESTFYPRIPDASPDPDFWRRESHFNDGFAKYGEEGDSWNRRIELYLLDCGVTPEEIDAFRTIMLE